MSDTFSAKQKRDKLINVLRGEFSYIYIYIYVCMYGILIYFCTDYSC